MKRIHFLSKFLYTLPATIAVVILMGSVSNAAVSVSGNTMPNGTPSEYWTPYNLYIGFSEAGTLTISDGSLVANASGNIGYGSSSSGLVTVDGSGSTWTNNDRLYVGAYGAGTLVITNGGSAASLSGDIGYTSNSVGTVTVDGEGSIWSINNYLDVGTSSSSGALSITNGGSVTDKNGYVGYGSGSGGTVTVDGKGSTWINSNALEVGGASTGTLSITNGGLVTDSSGIIGRFSNSRGAVTINGENSTWANSGILRVGYFGTGSLSVTGGGQTNASYVSINNDSTLTVDAGFGSLLKVGAESNNWTQNIDNNGIVRLVAGAGAAAGTYTPMSYGTMTGSGILQALGGIWDMDTHTITVTEAVTTQGAGGATVSLDLALNQRVLITDTNTGMSAGAGFMGTDISAIITLTATAISGDDINSLENLIAGTGEEVLSAWNFSTTEYKVSEDSPVYLSLYAGSAGNILDLSIWYLLGDEWLKYEVIDFAFDGTFASFTVTELGKYAVTAAPSSPIPVPGTIWLLSAGMLGLTGFKRRLEKQMANKIAGC